MELLSLPLRIGSHDLLRHIAQLHYEMYVAELWTQCTEMRIRGIAEKHTLRTAWSYYERLPVRLFRRHFPARVNLRSLIQTFRLFGGDQVDVFRASQTRYEELCAFIDHCLRFPYEEEEEDAEDGFSRTLPDLGELRRMHARLTAEQGILEHVTRVLPHLGSVKLAVLQQIVRHVHERITRWYWWFVDCAQGSETLHILQQLTREVGAFLALNLNVEETLPKQ
jgi:hypothetical protein